jgi:hypothetical protein
MLLAYDEFWFFLSLYNRLSPPDPINYISLFKVLTLADRSVEYTARSSLQLPGGARRILKRPHRGFPQPALIPQHMHHACARSGDQYSRPGCGVQNKKFPYTHESRDALYS